MSTEIKLGSDFRSGAYAVASKGMMCNSAAHPMGARVPAHYKIKGDYGDVDYYLCKDCIEAANRHEEVLPSYDDYGD